MNIVGEIKETYKSIPDSIKSFLKRALLVFIIWKLVYHVFLFNGRLVDAPLTHLTSGSTIRVLSLVYPDKYFFVHEECDTMSRKKNEDVCLDFIGMDKKSKIIGIADGCNALELYVLYIGFIFCMPTRSRRMIGFIIIGILVIYISNILRCSGIALMNIHHNRLTNVAHHYIFKLVVYGFIFLLWLAYYNSQIDAKYKKK